MPIDSENLALKGLDDLFSTEENRQEEQREQVQQIPIDDLHPFTNHPFKVLDDEAMTRTVESIAQYGVLAPLIARPRPDGDGYEIISGHRRQYAAKLAGLETLPVIVRQMSDDAAVILMVDSNLQREHILPSERAFAYKMKLDAIKNQGARSDLTSTQVAQKLSVEKVGDDAGVSKDTIRRFIRLTNLIPELLDMVDEKRISFNPAVELSYLDESQQRDFLEAMDGTQNAPSVSQAQQLKKMAQCGEFTYEKAFDILGQEKNRNYQKRHPAKILSTQLYASANGRKNHSAFGCVAEKTAAPQRTLIRNARPDGVFFVCKNLEVTPMNNTIPFHPAAHAPQITVDVNILSMLKQAASCLTEMASENIYLAAIDPDMELTIIMEEDAPSILPCFDEDDALISVKGAPLFISHNPAQVLKLAGKRYLTGPVIFYRTDGHGAIVSLTVEDIYRFQTYLESHSTTLMADGQKLTCICID